MIPPSPTLRFLAWPFAACMFAGVLLALLAPFETAQIFSLPQRLAFWPIVSLLSGAMLLGLYLVGRGVGRDFAISIWVWLPLSALITAIPTTLIVQATANAIDPAVQLSRFSQLLPSVLMLCLPMQLVLHLVLRQPSAPLAATDPLVPTTPSPEVAQPAEAPLLSRLPGHLGEEILCIKTEDHYLQVHTDRGQAMILMRMADAEQALGNKGLRVHRGWWVARAAVVRAEQTGGKLILILSNGLKVPVSRDRRRLIEAEGWSAHSG